MNRNPLLLLVLLTGCASAGSPARTPPKAVTDADLVKATSDCPDPCNVIGRVSLPSGDTFAVLVSDGGAKYVLARGDRILDAQPPVGLDELTPQPPVTDSSGNALVVVTGNTASAVHPFREVTDRLVLTQGMLQAPQMNGDNNTEVKDTDGNGVLEVLVGDHEMTASGLLSATTPWTWDGTVYHRGTCTNDQGIADGKPCPPSPLG